MIRLDSVSKQHGNRILFLDASMSVFRGEKVGLVGPNGSGKSTIFRMIVGEEPPDSGQVAVERGVSIGYFSQDVGEMAGRTVLEETMAGAGEVSEAAHELHALEHAMADPARADELEALIERFGHAQARFDELGGYALESRAREILAGLGFSGEFVEGDVGRLSGGWKMRVGLARILLMRPDALLLDEPTNHLDIESIIWLERFLRDFQGGLVMTSHDREFINRLVTKIVEIDGGDLTTFSGDYDFYERQREIAAAQQEAQYARQQAMLAKEQAFIDRFKARASHAAQVQSRVKKLDKIEKVEPPRRRKIVEFDFRPAPRSGDDVAKLEGVAKGYGARRIYDGLDLLVRRRERWCVMGVNGAGKSTLLKLIAGEARPGLRQGGDRRQREARLLRAARDGGPRPGAERHRDAARGVSARHDRLDAHSRGSFRLLGRRRREALPRPVGRGEGAARARRNALRPSELPRAGRADQPPGHRDQGDAGQGAVDVRGDDALRVARPGVSRRPFEPRPRGDAGRRARLRGRIQGIRREHGPRGARASAEESLPRRHASSKS